MTQISKSDKSERAALIERLIQLHEQVQLAYALQDERRLRRQDFIVPAECNSSR